MKKIALHINRSGKLVLLEYKDVDEKKKSSFLQGEEVYDYLRKFAKKNIVDIYENPNGKDMVLEYDKYIIELNDHTSILKKHELSEFLDRIRIYHEKKELSKQNHKKVSRKNKYVKVRIAAGGLSFLILSGCMMGMTHKSKKNRYWGS